MRARTRDRTTGPAREGREQAGGAGDKRQPKGRGRPGQPKGNQPRSGQQKGNQPKGGQQQKGQQGQAGPGKPPKGGSKGQGRNRSQGNRNRSRNRRQRRSSGGASFWGDPAKLPEPRTDVRMTDDPSALPRSLGPPPLPGHEVIAEHYFTAVYDRAVATAGALAAAGGLIDPNALVEDEDRS